MFDLKCVQLISQLTGVEPWQVKPVKFGYTVAYEGTTQITLASQMVPDNVGLAVARVQCYLVNIDNTLTDYGIWRVFPEGTAFWDQSRTAGGTSVTNFTATPAPGQLPLDCDELLLFPPGWIINLRFTPSANPPATGTWRIRTTVFGFFIPPEAYSALGGSQDWISVQQ